MAAPVPVVARNQAPAATARALLERAPVRFIENAGQVAGSASFVVPGTDKHVAFARDGVTFLLAPSASTAALQHVALAPAAGQPTRVRLEFVDANRQVHPVGEALAPTTFNYLRGEASSWRTNVRTFERVVYPELWPGIDLVYRGARDGIKYSFIVRPGADPSRIRLAYAGADAVTLDAGGGLAVSTASGAFGDAAPVSFQGDGAGTTTVDTRFVLGSRESGRTEFGFALGDYDTTRELVIDPAVNVMVGFLGAGGLDEVNGIASDAGGNIYVAGATLSATALASGGAFQTTPGGATDAFVAKLDPTGAVLYVTYLGGSNDDVANGIAVDPLGNAYVTGYTHSADFPHDAGVGDGHFRRTHNAADGNGTGNGSDAFVTKLAADGASIVYSGFIGGSGEDVAHAIALDATGAAYIAGSTSAPTCTSSDFPATVGPVTSYTPSAAPLCMDAFAGKIKVDGSGVDYLGFIGGSGGTESGHAIAVDPTTGEAFVAGETDSPTGGGFPATAGSFGTTTGDGLAHAFLVKITADGTGFVYAGVLAGDGQDRALALALDTAGNAYLAGDTQSTGLATAGAAQTVNSGAGDPFASKIDTAGAAIVYTTYLGGNQADAAKGIVVDAAGSATITGFTPLLSQTVATPGLDTTPNGANDAFLIALDAAGTAKVFAGYLGGTGGDVGNALAGSADGKYYLAGTSASGDGSFPVTGVPANGAFSQTYQGAGDGFVAVIGEHGPVTHFGITAAPSAIGAGGSVGLVVTALDSSDTVVPDYVGTIHFTSSDGLATLPSDYTFVAGDAGTHTFPAAATLRTAGAQTIAATDTGNASITGTSNPVAVSSGGVVRLVVVAPPTATPGAPFDVTVTAQDAFGNTVTGYTGTVHFTSTDASATLPADAALVSGTGSFSATLRTAGTHTITGTDTLVPGLAGTSDGIAVAAGAATRLAVAAPASATSGSAFDLTVTALDAFDNTATTYAGTVHFTSSDGTATLPADAVLANGTGTFSATLRTPGAQALTAADTVAPSITGTANVTVAAGPATRFAVVAPGSATAGAAFAFTVTARDALDNTVTGYTGTVHFTSTDAGALLPANATLVNGVGTFDATLVTAGTQTLTATDTVNAAITGTSNAIAVSAGAAARLAVAAPATAVSGTPFAFTVTARDAFDNPVTGYAGTAHFTSTDPAAVLPANAPLVNGAGTFDATFVTAGIRTITATDTITASITGTSGGIAVASGAPATIITTAGTPQDARALAAYATPLQVTVRDGSGNPVAGASVTFTAPASGASVTPVTANALTDAAGIATAPALTANGVVGAFTVTATVAGVATPASFALTNSAWLVYTGSTATGTGIATATLSGGGPSCTYANAAFVGLPVPAPADTSFPDGLFDFTATGCDGPVTLTVVFPTAFNLQTRYWKYGPVPPGPPPKPSQWYTLGAGNGLTLAGHTATFTIADGGLGDDDLTVNGTIVDQGGPGSPGATPAAIMPIPTLSDFATALLALLLLLAGGTRLARRRGGR